MKGEVRGRLVKGQFLQKGGGQARHNMTEKPNRNMADEPARQTADKPRGSTHISCTEHCHLHEKVTKESNYYCGTNM